MAHQICWPHLLRRLKLLEDTEDNPWIHQLEKLFRIAEALDKEKAVWTENDKQIISLEKKLNNLLFDKVNQKKFPKSRSLQKKLLEIRHMLFTFLYHEGVPFHNNGTEKTFRIAKPKMKISGQFKSVATGQLFAVNRSIIDTLIKNGMPIFETLYKLEAMEDIDFGFSQVIAPE